MTQVIRFGLWNHSDLSDDHADLEGSASHQREDVKVRQQVNCIYVTELYHIVLKEQTPE
jgi:hypothetical protein